MVNLGLYTATVLIWGSTWLAIKFQLTEVPPALSVGYRFLLAAAILFLYGLLKRRRLTFSGRDHLFMASQGAFLFAGAYCLTYLAEVRLTSGLVAVLFSTIPLWNILNLRLFMGQPVARRALAGGLIGLGGICLVFWQDLVGLRVSASLTGLGLSLTAAYLASLGNVIATRNARAKVPVTQANAFGMAYGAVLVLVFWLLTGRGFVFDLSPGYLLSLIYLTVFGSVLAFGCYITLIARIGAEYAAYMALMTPLLALGLSTLFEGYHWEATAGVGVGVVLLGNLLLINPRRRPATARVKISPPAV